MKTNQPVWKLVANLGDASAIEYGGMFVFEDSTGVYPPEIERIEQPADDYADYSQDNNWSPKARWRVHRAVCEPCTYVDGVLSDNRFHPEMAAWFADSVQSMCDCGGISVEEFVRMICNGNSSERGMAWSMIGDYHGWENLDEYPLSLDFEEVTKRVETHTAT